MRSNNLHERGVTIKYEKLLMPRTDFKEVFHIKWLYFCLVFTLLPFIASASQEKKKLLMIVSAGDSLNVARAYKSLNELPEIFEKYQFEFLTECEIRNQTAKASMINDADIIIADFMKREFDKFIACNLKTHKQKIYSLRCAYLAEKIKAKGYFVDVETEKYFMPASPENIKNLLLLTISKNGGKVKYNPPFRLPESGIFHPDAPGAFSTYDEFIKWYQKRGNFHKNGFWVGILTFSSSASTSALKDSGKIEKHLIYALEKEGINVLPVFGRPPYQKALKKYFLDKNGNKRVDSICGFSFRFLRGFPEETGQILSKINAPVFIPLEAHALTIKQWRKSSSGISPLLTTWQVCIPEENGAIEPTVLGGKTAARLKGMSHVIYDTIPMQENIDFFIKRVKAFYKLKITPNREKKIAVLYWNHPPGKQNIGASYMNCFRSIATIISAMRKEGYGINGQAPSENDIKKRIMLSGRNVGSWAPGELNQMISDGGVVQIPVSEYRKWFADLPAGFKESVIEQWGQPEKSDIMIKNSNIIIPIVNLGNIILLPQPSRGLGEDPEKLYHDPKIYPHHQYIAFYLWLKKKFHADAIISLGKHGTHEWLPGKQIGLSLSCSPEVLIQDIPNIYPYIVDNIGEGIQAKRRGRGVIIDHLIPALKKGGVYMEYRELTAMIDAYHNAQVTDMQLAEEKKKTVLKLILKLGLNKDLGLEELNDKAIEKVEHYILEMQESLIPYGHHTFGISPDKEALLDLTDVICAKSPEIKTEVMRAKLQVCGRNEITSLLKALNGGYISPGEGNDPVRNPDAVPTGKNFYGFNIDKVPSKEAFTIGKKLADKMVQDYLKKHGTYPDKLGIILWSTETQRNEGVSVAAVLSLLGIMPVWDKKDKVVDIKPIPGNVLKRPRIDVLIQASGLFRDSFSKVITLMDRAVQMAGSLKDVENFIAVNNRKIELALLEKGYLKDDAKKLSRLRVFGPMPGAYSSAIQELIPNSSVWETQQEIADVFIHHSSFAYGEKVWGKPLKSAYKNNLKDVKITMHTRSSNLYNMLDNDDMFAFLGGLSLAVKSQAGAYPDVQVANIQDKKSMNLEELSKSIGRALRTRYLNPKWIEGMKKENYSGARAMDEFVEHLWGFQVTTPFAVDGAYWEQIHDVYIKDKYDLDMKEFFDQNNPWAVQSIAARMLEADRKKYWQAPEDMKKSLALNYAVNVIEKGVACCEHTCNNPMLQEFVTSIISLNGLLSPRQLNQFKMIIAKAVGKTQKENQAENTKNRENLISTIKEIQKDESINAKTEGKSIEGFELIDEKKKETSVTAAGSSWVVMVIVCGILVLLFTGWKKKRI